MRQVHLDLLDFKEVVDEQFKTVDARFDRLEAKIDGWGDEIVQLNVKVDHLGREIVKLDSKVDAMPRAVAEIVVGLLKK